MEIKCRRPERARVGCEVDARWTGGAESQPSSSLFSGLSWTRMVSAKKTRDDRVESTADRIHAERGEKATEQRDSEPHTPTSRVLPTSWPARRLPIP
jgi:hypothetical protein